MNLLLSELMSIIHQNDCQTSLEQKKASIGVQNVEIALNLLYLERVGYVRTESSIKGGEIGVE